jgi:hypothetical protein
MRSRDSMARSGLTAALCAEGLHSGAASVHEPEPGSTDVSNHLAAELRAYRAALEDLRRKRPGLCWLPDARFFLFGAGPRRTKLVYQAGVLREGHRDTIVVPQRGA